ncbi:hypothetical protein AOLI_G00091040 [Acnodon oligacanthus]
MCCTTSQRLGKGDFSWRDSQTQAEKVGCERSGCRTDENTEACRLMNAEEPAAAFISHITARSVSHFILPQPSLLRATDTFTPSLPSNPSQRKRRQRQRRPPLPNAVSVHRLGEANGTWGEKKEESSVPNPPPFAPELL